jgi:Uma2 family endonuclease
VGKDRFVWQITVLIMQDTGYQERVYARQDRVISAAFPTLQVTVNEIFG